jgi:hypothetical protein
MQAPPLSDEDAALGTAFAHFLALQKKHPDPPAREDSRVELLSRTVMQMERRLDLIERLLAFQQQTNDALLRAVALAGHPPASHPRSVPAGATLAEAVRRDGAGREIAGYDDDEEDGGDAEHDSAAAANMLIQRVIVTSQPHAMLVAHDKCRRGAAA